MTQNEHVLLLLRWNGDRGLTPLEALDEVGTLRLAARIHDLRAEGHDIRSVSTVMPNGKTVARYVLIEAKPYEQMAMPL